MISNLNDLEQLFILLQKYQVSNITLDGVNIVINLATSNNEALKETSSTKKPKSIFEDEAFFQHLPQHIKLRGSQNDDNE